MKLNKTLLDKIYSKCHAECEKIWENSQINEEFPKEIEASFMTLEKISDFKLGQKKYYEGFSK